MTAPFSTAETPAARLRERVTRYLLAARNPAGFWEGRLSGSALSTAVASFALARIDPNRHAASAARGFDWLAAHANADGGWGDTADSPSNLSTTLLAWSALAAAGPRGNAAASRAGAWIRARAGSLEPAALSSVVLKTYGDDRTFSAPILAFCALAGRLGPEPGAWDAVPQLPFELAAVPRRFYAAIRLPVVSYALPALIAIGLVRHVRSGTRNPLARGLRHALTEPVLDLLARLQPEGGGFLEAAPLTGFVGVSLAGAGRADHPVALRAAAFLCATQREDGGWPIDTDLSVWVTTGAVSALLGAGVAESAWPSEERRALRDWFLARQHAIVHPFTGAAPGGWGWSHRSGAVPDADDTAGALLALEALDPESSEVRKSAAAGIRWLLDLQNRDGGIPTFCRGWGRLPFDRSCADLTAHALRAWDAWTPALPHPLQQRIAVARRAALAHLVRSQNDDGSWTPLWFGSQRTSDGENRTYGTAQVLRALRGERSDSAARVLSVRGLSWLESTQNPDGGWGGGRGAPSTIEETALAVTGLAAGGPVEPASAAAQAIRQGLAWLDAAWASDAPPDPVPIGLYFARLWYSERLYPGIFSLAAAAATERVDTGTQSPHIGASRGA